MFSCGARGRAVQNKERAGELNLVGVASSVSRRWVALKNHMTRILSIAILSSETVPLCVVISFRRKQTCNCEDP